MSEEKKNFELAELKLAIKIKNEWIWLNPGDLHELEDFGNWRLFLLMEHDGGLKISAGEKERPEEYQPYFS